jgi:nucleoside 2-deoxyribosyltransferase
MQVYVAHPAFNAEQRNFKKKFICSLKKEFSKFKKYQQVILVDPFDYSPLIEENVEDKMARSKEIKRVCLDLLKNCNILVAVVDGDDTGTAFEAGYAHDRDIPIILVSKISCNSANSMLLGSAYAMFDNVLNEQQISKLAYLIGTISGM